MAPSSRTTKIILALAPDYTAREIAELLDVHVSTVYGAASRHGVELKKAQRGRPPGTPNASRVSVRHEEVYKLAEGRTMQEVGDLLGISRQRVSQILLGNPNYKRRRGGWRKVDYQRFGRAVARAAWLQERLEEHGTLRRYRGYIKEFGPCDCDACRRANTEYTYAQTGFVPKFGGEAYQAYVKRHGIPHKGPLTTLDNEEE